MIDSLGGGSVTSPGEGMFYYMEGTDVPLVAKANAGSHFHTWTGTAVFARKVADPISATTSVRMDYDYDLQALFETNTTGTHNLDVYSTAGGHVVKPGQGSFHYWHGSTVTLLASSDGDYHFVGWEGSAAVAGKVANTSSADTTVKVDADYSVRARFAPGDWYALTISATAGGHVSAPGVGRFIAWTGTAVDAGKVADPKSAETTVIAAADYTLRASFGAAGQAFALLLAPNGDETLASGGTFSVRWNSEEAGRCVDIELSLDGGVTWTRIAECRTEQYDWLVPSPDSDRCFVRIRADNNGTVLDVSDSVFSIHRVVARKWYVDVAAIRNGDGTSWEKACTNLQDALTKAQAGDGVWVAKGLYWPGLGGGHKFNDRTATFRLSNGVAVYGGFPSGGGAWGQRDPSLHKTILSGDIGVPNLTSDNSLHVVSAGGTDRTAVLDGFTITSGFADGQAPDDCGAGLYCPTGGPTVGNCVFIANTAQVSGGAVHCSQGSPLVYNCIFVGNIAVAGDGGGVCDVDSPATFVNCLFNGNTAGGSGGAMHHVASDAMLVNCTFAANKAQTGGGVSAARCAITLTNCILWGNRQGQAVLLDESAQLAAEPAPKINRCCVQGWTGKLGGSGNFGADPLFVDYDGPDNLAGTPDDDLQLTRHSPCVDVGDDAVVSPEVATDLSGGPRVVGAAIDLGPYEFTTVARPVACWTLDEGSGVAANDSAGANQGTVHGAKWTVGQSGGALSFDGVDDYVDCGNAQILAPEEVTIAFWVSVEGKVAYQYVLGKANDMGVERDYTFSTRSDGRLEFAFSEDAWKHLTICSNEQTVLGQWVYVTAVRGDATASLYLNGKLEASATYSFVPSSKNQPLRIGSIGTMDGWAGFFKGKVDDVRIYDKTLSAEEIQELYEQVSQ